MVTDHPSLLKALRVCTSPQRPLLQIMHGVSLSEVPAVPSLHTQSMEFLDFSEVVLTKQFLDHVCYGDPHDLGKGGHISGMKREGKTEFPACWDEERIFWALRAVLQRPQHVEFSLPRISIRREVANVMIQFELMQGTNGLLPFAAYPIYGEGVMQNILGNQHHIPHHYSTRGK